MAAVGCLAVADLAPIVRFIGQTKLARRFHAAVAKTVANLKPLPDPLAVETQPTLW